MSRSAAPNAGAAPSGRAGDKWGLVTACFKKTACLERFLFRQGIEVTEYYCRVPSSSSLFRYHLELLQLAVCGSVWIHVYIIDADATPTAHDSSCHCQTRSPRALVPWEIDSCYLCEREVAQQCDACVAAIVKFDWLFKVQPPLARLRFDTARNSCRGMRPVHIKFSGQCAGDVMSASASCFLVSLLQGQNIDAR